ncbi:uncharacterized protein [Nicotiana sylvestris]|uniref:uncharacterized protein n=1 Tax=Nicotiana sylvestris TaxID=4096 RepID=UPI00388CBA55
MGPWLLMGDFNSILGVDDRMHGSEVQDNETKDFKEVIEDCSLAELPTVGKTYTWTNGHVYSRIDRAIVNDIWMINMPPRQVQILNPLFSDHSPLGIKVEIVESNWTMKNGERNWMSTRKNEIANPTIDLFEEEKKLLLQLEKWDKIEESIYKQKSRVKWLKLGDTNSAYFFASMKGRRTQNQITKLTNSNGDVLTDGKSIEAEVERVC